MFFWDATREPGSGRVEDNLVGRGSMSGMFFMASLLKPCWGWGYASFPWRGIWKSKAHSKVGILAWNSCS